MEKGFGKDGKIITINKVKIYYNYQLPLIKSGLLVCLSMLIVFLIGSLFAITNSNR